jgi:hypothetical protein
MKLCLVEIPRGVVKKHWIKPDLISATSEFYVLASRVAKSTAISALAKKFRVTRGFDSYDAAMDVARSARLKHVILVPLTEGRAILLDRKPGDFSGEIFATRADALDTAEQRGLDVLDQTGGN